MKCELEYKCAICKNKFNIEMPDAPYFLDVSKQKRYVHSHCYRNKNFNEDGKRINSKCTYKTLEECNAFIHEREQYTHHLLVDIINKDKLYRLLCDMYDASYISNYFFTKLESVYQGTYKNLTRPVPVEDLLDMWEQKKNELLKVYEQNKRKGNDMTPGQRLNYDLAILLGKYDSYLAWKEKQKMALAEIESRRKSDADMIIHQNFTRPKSKSQTENNKVDISSILDEI